MWQLSKDLGVSVINSSVTMKELNEHSKKNMYNLTIPRLKNFIDAITATRRSKTNNFNFKANVVENLLKARNWNFLSHTGLKEHLSTFLATGKNKLTSQVMCKQGGKGSRNILQEILDESERQWVPEIPRHVFVSLSFDNIQTMLRKHRMSSHAEDKQKKNFLDELDEGSE